MLSHDVAPMAPINVFSNQSHSRLQIMTSSNQNVANKYSGSMATNKNKDNNTGHQ